MAISQVIKFEGSPDDLVWKYSGEEFDATSQLIVDETHQAILVVNGQAADLFGPGRHTLSVPNIPIVKKIINIPTGGTSPFPCKVFYINQVHQMDMLWGTRGAITLDDPLYDVFLNVMLHGSMSFSVDNSRKLLEKLVGFRNRYSAEELVENFKGIVSSHVKDIISKIMINGMLSYFMINAHLFEISGVVKDRLTEIFSEYGIRIEYFNIETIEVPKEDYDQVSRAKERRASRLIEGYTWQEERQMMIAEKFAGNEGTMGAMGGAVGGFMMGGAMGGTIVDIAKNALDPNKIPNSPPPKNLAGTSKPWGQPGGFDVNSFLNGNSQQTSPSPAPVPSPAPIPSPSPAPFPAQTVDIQPSSATPTAGNGITCPNCSNVVAEGSLFCNKCGTKLSVQKFCTACGAEVPADSMFCNRCGSKIN